MIRLVDNRPPEELRADVLVIGGGAAGVAAAISAAREGLRVVLAERYGFCGGGAVAGLSGTVCGLYEASEGSRGPVQVVFGFADDFLSALRARGGLGPALRYGKTFANVHDPIVWRETADALVADAGVTVIFHALAVGALMEGGEKVEGALLQTKQGPVSVRAKLTIDASGDADVIAMAGLPSFVGDQGRVQNPTMIFRMMGVDVDAFVSAYGADTIMPPEVSQLIAAANSTGRYTLPRSKIWLFPTTHPGELLCNCTRITGADGRELNTLFHRDFTEAEILGRRQAREYLRFFKDYLAGCDGAFIEDTGVQVGVRQSRQGLGVRVLTNQDVVSGAKFADGVARSPWPIELHTSERPRVEWLIEDFYEVPYGCFIPERGEGLLFAGRCLSAEHEAVASARVTAQCFSYGQAVGVAAGACIRDGLAPRELVGAEVRDMLNQRGARLG